MNFGVEPLILDFVSTKKPDELGTSGRNICLLVGTVCLGMKPTQRKAKPSMEGAEGRELMSSFEPTDPPYLEARVHSLLGFHI